MARFELTKHLVFNSFRDCPDHPLRHPTILLAVLPQVGSRTFFCEKSSNIGQQPLPTSTRTIFRPTPPHRHSPPIPNQTTFPTPLPFLNDNGIGLDGNFKKRIQPNQDNSGVAFAPTHPCAGNG